MRTGILGVAAASFILGMLFASTVVRICYENGSVVHGMGTSFQLVEVVTTYVPKEVTK